jgi:hypothetical protein
MSPLIGFVKLPLITSFSATIVIINKGQCLGSQKVIDGAFGPLER